MSVKLLFSPPKIFQLFSHFLSSILFFTFFFFFGKSSLGSFSQLEAKTRQGNVINGSPGITHFKDGKNGEKWEKVFSTPVTLLLFFFYYFLFFFLIFLLLLVLLRLLLPFFFFFSFFFFFFFFFSLISSSSSSSILQ